MPVDLTQFPQRGYFDVWERSRQAAWEWTHFCKYMFNIAHRHTHTHTHNYQQVLRIWKQNNCVPTVEKNDVTTFRWV